MRETLTSLQTAFHDYTQTTTSDGSQLTTFRDREINNAITFIGSYLRSYMQSVVRTTPTVADQQYYHFPADISQPPIAVTVIDGTNRYPLTFVESTEMWNRLNSIQFEAVGIPTHVYPRAKDYGIYPTPQTADYTIELEFNFFTKDLSQSDYTTGTITATSNSATITGSGTTFADWMTGAWIKLPDGVWYQIETKDSTTQLTLETVYEGTTTAGATYTIGESPQLPPELHELIPHRAASKYFGSMRRDTQQSQYNENIFWTGDPNVSANNEDNAQGGIIGAKKMYASRSDGAIVYSGSQYTPDPLKRLVWGTELS